MAKLRAGLILMIVFVSLVSWYKNQRREEAAAIIESPATSPAPILSMNLVPKTPPAFENPISSHKSAAAFVDLKNQKLISECLR